MELGFLGDLTEQECRLAASIGYDCIEARPNWKIEDLRKDDFIKAESERIKAMLARHGIGISALGLYGYRPPDLNGRVELYGLGIEMCRALEVGVIAALTGGDPARTLEENLDEFEAVFSRVEPLARDAGVKIAFENWPGLTGAFPPVGTCNFGFTPEVWEQMFSRVDSQYIGLEFDPSHLVWQFVDWAGALEEFISKVYHVHAKDTEIMSARLAAGGFFCAGWWRYRLPGYGVVDWRRMTSMLKEAGYEGGICVEHEDAVFSGPRREEGLRKAHAYLRPMV